MVTNKTEITGTPSSTTHSITTNTGIGYINLSPFLASSSSYSPPDTTTIEIFEKQFPKKIIKHGPALIIFWDDKGKDKTVVKKQKGKKITLN